MRGWLILLAVAVTSCSALKKTDGTLAPMASKELVKKMEAAQADFHFVRWKGQGKAVREGESQTFRIELRMLRDSVLWFDIADPILGIKVVRGQVTRQGMVYYNKLDQEYYEYTQVQLEKLVGGNLGVHELQEALWGNPVVPIEATDYEESIVNNRYQLGTANAWNQRNLRQVVVQLNPSNFRIAQQEITDFQQNKALQLNYSNWNTANEPPIGCTLQLKLFGGKPFEILLELNPPEHTEEIHLPFQIPSGYAKGN